MVFANTAFAHGAGGAGSMGFGFMFLNFIGHVLFLLLIFWVIKNFVFNMRGETVGNWGPPGNWRSRKEAWKARHQNSQDSSDNQATPKTDAAMTTARQRLADGEIQPYEFELIQQGLGTKQANQADFPNDSAIDTARMRFAKSELTAEEFEAVKKALQGTPDQV